MKKDLLKPYVNSKIADTYQVKGGYSESKITSAGRPTKWDSDKSGVNEFTTQTNDSNHSSVD